MTTYDRSFETNGTSSVIDKVFYNSDTKELYVQLHRESFYGEPVVAGYQDVPEEVYAHFELENTNRVNGDYGHSVGVYWNTFIKPNFTGLNTDGLELESAKQPAPEVAEYDDAVTLTNVSAADDEDEALTSFVVAFTNGKIDGEIMINAENGDNALDAFYEIAEVAGWGDVEVAALTQLFVSF